MKKLFLTVAIALGTLTAVNAQEVGQMWVGGTVGFWSSKDKGEDSELSFKVLPEFGYVISENIGVGISIGAGHSHTGSDEFVNTNSSKDFTNFYQVNPFLRYTFLKGDLGSLFVDGGVSFGWNKSKGTTDVLVDGKVQSVGYSEYGHEWNVGIKPGVALNVSNKVSLLGKFGFIGYQAENGGYRSFGIDLDMRNIELGMNLKF